MAESDPTAQDADDFGVLNNELTVGPLIQVFTGKQNMEGEPIPNGGVVVKINFSKWFVSASIKKMNATVRLPELPEGSGKPELRRQFSFNNWQGVPEQEYTDGVLTARVTHYGYYQVFAPVLDPPFAFGEVYVFPNPVRGHQIATLHVEVSPPDKVSTRVYDVSGDLVYESRLAETPIAVGGKAAIEHVLESGRFRSGVYFGVVTAEKAGEETIRKRYRFSVIK